MTYRVVANFLTIALTVLFTVCHAAVAATGNGGTAADGVVIASSPSQADSPAKPATHCADKPIKFAALTWESGQFTTAVLELILQTGYGCVVDKVPGATPALETALAQNDIQVIAEQWVGRSPIMQTAVAKNQVAVVGDTLKGGATQGWYVPDYVLEQYPQLRSYHDLSDHAHLFTDPEDPKRARFLNCPTGWICEVFNTRLLNNTGLQSQFNNVHPGTGAALDAAIASAFEQRQPLLFYYWQPTGLMAKYNFAQIGFPEFDEACWQTLLDADGSRSCVSGFAVSQLGIAVSTPFAQQHPELIAVFERLQVSPELLNQAILDMSETHTSPEQQAEQFIRSHPELWQSWVSEAAAQRMTAALGMATPVVSDDAGQLVSQPVQPNDTGLIATLSWFPEWSLEKPLNRSLNTLVQDYGDLFRSVSQTSLTYLLLPVENAIARIPPWLMIGLLAAVAWLATKKLWFGIASGLGLFLIGAFGLWVALVQTLALLLVSVLMTVLIGIPIGILMAGSALLRRLITPLLDVMQTMPSFVYLIPVLMLFGIGKVPALFATVVYALPPLIRLTMLGIRQVNREMVEAGRAFGSSHWQILRWIKLPQALPSIMAGINQAVMMSLSMVVLASMIGAPGLGEDVLQSIQTLNIGQGLQAGTAIVIVAIIIDRVTQAFGQGRRTRHRAG